MTEKQSFQAQIAGKEYTIVGNKTPEHMKAVVDLVNQQLDQLSQISPELSFGDRYALMTVNAVSTQLDQEEEIMHLEEQIQELTEEVEQLKAENKSLRPRNTIAPRESLSEKALRASQIDISEES